MHLAHRCWLAMSFDAGFPTGQAVVGLVSGKERKKVKGGLLREAKTNPAMVSFTRIPTWFRRQAFGSLVMAKASRLGKFFRVPPARSASQKTKVVWPMRKNIKKAIPVRYHDGLSQLRPNAGGIDIGASDVWVDVGNKDAEPVRKFETFTADLNRMGDWLKSCGIPDRGDGIDGSVLDSGKSDSGIERDRSLFSECAAGEKCEWA